jgi:hypothetical protein
MVQTVKSEKCAFEFAYLLDINVAPIFAQILVLATGSLLYLLLYALNNTTSVRED